MVANLSPSPQVLAAFGLVGASLGSLPGGQGSSWLATPIAGSTGSGGTRVSVVLKPVGDGVEALEVAWLAGALAGVPAPGAGFRLAAQVPTGDGRWIADGWRASTWLPGQAGPAGRWAQLLATAQAFTAAVAHLPRPAWLDQRTHPWALADRAAWDEQRLDTHRDLDPLLARLRALTAPAPHRRCQLVHGDLAGNVLFAPGLAPGVIDVSPYWRPAPWAASVIVADALLWWDQGADLVAAAGEGGAVDLVARALAFRLLTHAELLRTSRGAEPLPAGETARYQRAADLLTTSSSRPAR